MSVGFVNNALVITALLFGIRLAWLGGVLGAVAGGVVIWMAGILGIWMIDTTIGYDGLGAILWPIFGLPLFIVGLTPVGLLGARRLGRWRDIGHASAIPPDRDVLDLSKVMYKGNVCCGREARTRCIGLRFT